MPDILEYSSVNSRQSNMFNREAVAKITKKLFKGLSGVDNIYTQHTPLLTETLEDLIKGKLSPEVYPFLGQTVVSKRYSSSCAYSDLELQFLKNSNFRPQDIIVFMVGGTTYEESLNVHNLNKLNPGTQIVLGGTTVHNFNSFMEEVESATLGVRPRYRPKYA